MGLAVKLKQQGLITHDMRFGGDWNRDYDVKDNDFNDLFHYELVN
jgi:peptidoglycan L-alanyl-D-glutamate endopeptidase CwlK